jgi:hypothetical protein
VRALVFAAAIATAIVAHAAPAAAQLCHDLPPLGLSATEPGGHHHDMAGMSGMSGMGGMHDHGGGFGFGIGLRMEAASTIVDELPASYQGVALHAHVHAGPIVVAAHLPAYRLDSARGLYYGTGDLHVEAWLRVVRRPAVSAGVGLPVGLPTGSAERLLGMGHVMIMPAAFVAVRRGPFDAIALAAYHRALGGSGEHEHAANGPAVAPMAKEEVAAAAQLTYWLDAAGATGAVAETGFAVPLVDGASTRAAAGVGARVRRGRYDVTVTVQLGLAGDPFIARGVVELHVMP